MAAYSQFLGASVTVQYRLGDILLSASGTFVGDSGRSIFLEQRWDQRGRRSYFRWEIPYPSILTIERSAESMPAEEVKSPEACQQDTRAAAKDLKTSDAGVFLPLPQTGRTA